MNSGKSQLFLALMNDLIITVGRKQFDSSKNDKLMGTTKDDTLTLKDHLRNISKKVYLKIGVLAREPSYISQYKLGVSLLCLDLGIFQSCNCSSAEQSNLMTTSL